MKSPLASISVMFSNDSTTLLEKLTIQQHLHPHRDLKRVLEHAALKLEYCPASTGRAVQWLGLDASTSIGRVRRTELAQLARSIHRFSKQMRNPARGRAFAITEI